MNLRPLHSLLVALAALAVALVALVTGLGASTSNQHIVNRAQGNLKKRAVQAVTVAANTTADTACNPAPGGAKAGSCAPHEASAATGALAKAAGDPWDVSHLGPLGVDISSYQPCGRVGPQFSFYKATEGTYYSDGCLRANVAASKRLHRPFGAYDFLRPGSSSPEAEAAHFVSVVRAAGATGSLPPVADVEANRGLSPSAVLNYVCRWHSYVRSHLGVRTTITYTGYWFWQPQVAAGSCGSLLWISAYASTYYVPHGFSRAVIWQYGDGRNGPTPRLYGWDSDVWLGKGAESLEALAGAGVPPTSTTAKKLCGRLKQIRRYVHRHGGRWHDDPDRLAEAKKIKRRLAAPRHYGGYSGAWVYECKTKTGCRHVKA